MDQLRIECWNQSVHALGTSYIFQLKSKFYKRWIRIITILGLAVPLLIGATASVYGQDSKLLGLAIAVTAPITVLQAILSGISLAYKWDDQLAYSLESQSDNRHISQEYQNLAKYPPSDLNEFDKQLAIIKTKDEARTKQDEKITFSNKENKMGLRYALWILKRECATCEEVPNAMTPTKCETCGNF